MKHGLELTRVPRSKVKDLIEDVVWGLDGQGSHGFKASLLPTGRCALSFYARNERSPMIEQVGASFNASDLDRIIAQLTAIREGM